MMEWQRHHKNMRLYDADMAYAERRWQAYRPLLRQGFAGGLGRHQGRPEPAVAALPGAEDRYSMIRGSGR